MTAGGALSIPGGQDSDDDSRWAGISKIHGPRWARFPTITLALLGVQIFWSTEMAYASPYLLSLGLSKSLMALVFVAGPLSGLIMQPLIGMLADNSKSRFGRRRPYMLIGCMFCVFSMILFGFTRSFSNIFTAKDSRANDILTIWLAVIAVYFIDFSINAVQAVDRALLVDTLPAPEQASGNAWAARMLGIGSVVGFLLGTIDLPSILPFLGSEQLEVLAALACLLLLFTHGITARFVQEKVLLSKSGPRKTIMAEMYDMFSHLKILPWSIKQICYIQFFAWIGWFPIIFYTTTYIGDIYKANSPAPSGHDAEIALDAAGTRLGSRAMLYQSIISLACNFALPFFVSESSNASKSIPKWVKSVQVNLASLWAASHLIFALCMAATLFVSSVAGTTILVAILGFSWAVTQWAPFSLLAEAILTESTTDDVTSIMLSDTRRRSRAMSPENDEERQFLFVNPEDEDEEEADKHQANKHSPLMGNLHARTSTSHLAQANGNGTTNEAVPRHSGDLSAKAGIILGIHNISIVIPQFLVTGLSAVIFAILDPSKSTIHPGHAAPPAEARDEPAQSGPNAVGVVFRLGGISAAIAFVLCWRLARKLRHR